MFHVLKWVNFTKRTRTRVFTRFKSVVSYCFYYILYYLLFFTSDYFLSNVPCSCPKKRVIGKVNDVATLHNIVSWFLTSWPPRPPLFSKSEHGTNDINQALTQHKTGTFLGTWLEHGQTWGIPHAKTRLTKWAISFETSSPLLVITWSLQCKILD